MKSPSESTAGRQYHWCLEKPVAFWLLCRLQQVIALSPGSRLQIAAAANSRVQPHVCMAKQMLSDQAMCSLGQLLVGCRLSACMQERPLLELLSCIEASNISMCLCGSAGTGRTGLLRESISPFLGAKYADRPEAVWDSGMTAMVVATLGGTMLHSLSGIGHGLGTARQIAKNMHHEAGNRWLDVECIIVEEVSMLSDPLINTLEEIGRIMRNDRAWIGGPRHSIYPGRQFLAAASDWE